MAKAATKAASKKAPAKKPAKKQVPAGSRKSLDEMSESHRAHVERWLPHQENLKAEFVWIAVRRYPERKQEGPHYVAIKRGDKDYAIVSYDTSKPKPITKKDVLDEGFTSSRAMLEAFSRYRQIAREERKALSGTPASAKAKAAAKKAKGPAKPKAAVKKTAKPATTRAKKPRVAPKK